MGFCPPNVRVSLAERWQYKLPWLATEAVSLQRETARSSWDYSAARFRGLHPPNFFGLKINLYRSYGLPVEAA